MQYSTLLLATLTTPIIAQSVSVSCNGELFDNYCCEGGSFTGPVISSFSSSLSSESVSRESSLSAASTSRDASQSSLQASLSSQFSNSGIRTEGAAAAITAAPVVKRAITTEVTSGLTCVGSTAFAVNLGTTATAGSSSGSAGAAGTSSTTTGGAAFITQAPMLMGAAAAVAAYGAM